MLGGCSIIASAPGDSEADFELICSRWSPNIIVCEDYIVTDPITGHLKIWNYKDDPYHGSTALVCGADLILNTGNPLQDYIVQKETEGELLCINAEENDLSWSWEDDSIFTIEWENLYLSIEIPECPYAQKVCTVNGYGYLSVD